MRKKLWIPLVALALGSTACYPWPATPTGNFLGVAHLQIGHVDPPYSVGGFWCWRFVNWVGEVSEPGWVDAQGPGTFPLVQDPLGPQPGDVVLFAPGGQLQTITHVGIVFNVSTGDFSSIEGNSATAPDEVVVNYHPVSGVGPDGLEAVSFLSP